MSEDPDFDMKVVKKDTMKERTSGAAAEQDEEPTSGRTLDDLPEIEWVPDDWDLTTIGEVAESVVGGGTPLKSEAKYWGGKIPWASVKDLDGTTADSTEDFITEEGVENSATNLIPSGSIIVSTRMTVGEAFMNLVDMAINQDLKAIRPDQSRSNTYFLTYALRGKDEYLKSLGRGTTVSGITTADLKRTHLSLPPLPEQRKIASVLYAVDQALHKTEEIIEQTKRLKQGLVQDLIVDRDSKKFEVFRLKEVISNIKGGYAFKSSQYSKKGIPLVQTKNFANRDDIKPTGEFKRIPKSMAEEKGEYVLSGGELLISMVGSNGEVCMIPENMTAAQNQNIWRLETKENVKKEYLMHLLYGSKKKIKRAERGSTRVFLGKNEFKNLKMTIPPIELQKEICNKLKHVSLKIDVEKDYKEQLEVLKRGLMQDLLTGEVRTADKAIEVLGEVKAHG
jgi:type I restriction enzyme S subunit